MNLLLLDQFSDLGGAQQALLELLPSIRAREWNALVGLPGEGEMFARVRASGFATARVNCGPYRPGRKSLADLTRFMLSTPLLAAQIRRLARRIRADLVYVNGPRLLPGVALARLRGPVVFHAHSFLFPGKGRQVAGKSLRRIGASVVGSCEFVAAPWREFVGQRVSVILNGVPGPAEPIWKAETMRAPVVACIGRIAREKGQLEFLRAAGKIHRALPECRFAVYGAALFGEPGTARYEADVRSAAAGLPVEFAGWIRNVYQALAKIDLLLVPSAPHEATTRVILEAFAAGVPVIAFRAGGIPEVVDDGRNGFLVNSAEEMAQLALELLGNRERLEMISTAARQSWSDRFNLERFHAELLANFEQALRNPRKAR